MILFVVHLPRRSVLPEVLMLHPDIFFANIHKSKAYPPRISNREGHHTIGKEGVILILIVFNLRPFFVFIVLYVNVQFLCFGHVEELVM